MKRAMKFVFGALGALAVPILAGCGGGGGSSPTPITPVVPLPHSVSAALPNGLTATLAEDKTSVPVGGVVTYTMTLTNNTAQPITFRPVQKDTRPSAGVGDALIVSPTQGEARPPTFPAGGFTQVITTGPSNTLAPGKSASGTVTVGPGGPGGLAADGSYTSPSGFLDSEHYIANVYFTLQTGQDASSMVTTMVGALEVDVP